MVEVKVNKKTGKCEIIDDAEGTPGASRQITKFRQYCLPILEKIMIEIYTKQTSKARQEFENKAAFTEYGFVPIGWNEDYKDYLQLIWDYKESENE